MTITTRTIEIAAVSDEEILAFTRPGWSKGHAHHEAADLAATTDTPVRHRHNGEDTIISPDQEEER